MLTKSDHHYEKGDSITVRDTLPKMYELSEDSVRLISTTLSWSGGVGWFSYDYPAYPDFSDYVEISADGREVEFKITVTDELLTQLNENSNESLILIYGTVMSAEDAVAFEFAGETKSVVNTADIELNGIPQTTVEESQTVEPGSGSIVSLL